ncbi:MAG: glycosyltransferase [Pseudomonadota bacterium]|nr:glycosyltransferase [Pseudomonadota bacterium]
MLSVVIIGRNESEHLLRLSNSINSLKDSCPFPIESIYIDSASTDMSSNIAKDQFDKIESLTFSEHLCASAGRYVGTCEAIYPWILYLDGDMELCEEFHQVIKDLDKLDDRFIGVLGLYLHRFDNGRSTVQTFRRPFGANDSAMHFGGAVVLRRDAILQAGNWDPALYGKEEIELYARLGDGKQVVSFVNIPMIYHYSEYYTRLEIIKRLMTPVGGLGKVFWGYGQCLRASFVKGKFRALVKIEYELYAFWLTIFLLLILALSGAFFWSLFLASAVVTALSLWSRPGSIVRYLLQPLSLAGWFRYFPWFRPMLRKWEREGDQAS